MSEPQNQDCNVNFQAVVQAALTDPEFAERRGLYHIFFQADATRFETKVPSDRIIQVKKIFKLLKELDP